MKAQFQGICRPKIINLGATHIAGFKTMGLNEILFSECMGREKKGCLGLRVGELFKHIKVVARASKRYCDE